MASRNVIIAGAGIGGLTAALTLARAGFRVTLLEQARRLTETGAGIQLSPNATRILIGLGLGERLRADSCAPRGLTVMKASGGRLARMPLGDTIEHRHGAPYWSIHRGDLQTALVEAVRTHPDIAFKLGTRVEDFVVHAKGITVGCRRGAETADEQGIALIGADGLWSEVRARLGHGRPQFAHRTAWRATLAADELEDEIRGPEVRLWLGRRTHLVHYPVKGGAVINLVAIVADRWQEPGWGVEGSRDDLLSHFSPWRWAQPALDLLAKPERWLKWALYDMRPFSHWGQGPVTLLGDAAHPMLPFLAQGAAMAIEDAAVLAECLTQTPNDPAAAMRRYERARRRRTARVQRAARSNGWAYQLGGAEALARNLALRIAGGSMLLRRYDWLYHWRLNPK